jgi:hypothetical protein
MTGSPAGSSVRAKDRAFSEGFVVAALLAPVMALAVFLVGILGAAVLSEGMPGSIWQAVGPLLFVLVIVFITGALPSLVFGGAVLALIRAMGVKRSPIVCALGGGVAAALYVAVSIWLAFASPGATLLLAPWAALLTMKEPGSFPVHMQVGDFWAPACIVISGVVAGLIYARSTQKG